MGRELGRRPSKSIADIVRFELRRRGWREYERQASRVSSGWVHHDGTRAASLHDAFVKQLIRETRT